MNQGEKITDPAFMFMLLKRLQQHKSLLSITVPRRPGIFTTAILDLSVDPPSIVFDELIPKVGHDYLLKTRLMDVEGRLDNVRIKMQCVLEKHDQSESISKYHVSFPPHLWYFQQRDSYRVQIGGVSEFSARVRHQENGWLDAHVNDVSETGMGLVIDRHVALAKGDLIRTVEIALPSQRRIFCKLVVRHLVYDNHQNTTQIGARIVDLEPHDKREFVKAINDAQRNLIRRQARYAEAG